MVRLLLLVSWLVLLVAGCGGTVATSAPASLSEDGTVTQRFPGFLRIEVTPDGQVLVEGTPMTVAQLTTLLDGMAADPPAVLYHRSNPTADPPAIATDVIDAITAHRLPVKLEAEDFNAPDYVPPPTSS